MRGKLLCLVLAVVGLVSLTASARAEFDVDWGYSWDDPSKLGYEFVGQWLVDNSYFSDIGLANDFAQNGYIGADAGDPDPFYWNKGQHTFQVVYENAGNSEYTRLGYYTNADGTGKTRIFYGDEFGPETIDFSDQFGLYIRTPNGGNVNSVSTWTYFYTDRDLNSNDKPQALVYELEQNKWLVAWEDLSLCKSDRDYNDMFVTVNAVPEPASMALFGLGGVLLAFARRKHKKA